MNVAVVGLGKLGMPMAALFASAGHTVIGIDVERAPVEALDDRRDPYGETGLYDLLQTIPRVRLRGSLDFGSVEFADVVFIVVPTPSDEDGKFSNRYVLDAIERLGPYLKDRWRTIVVSSTVMPGSMSEVIAPTLELATGRELHTEVGLAYNPQFIALGSVLKDMAHPDFVLTGAGDKRSVDDVVGVLDPFLPHIEAQAMTFVNAEITKLGLNCAITTKISFANTLAGICEAVPGADASVVTHAIGLDSRIGGKYFRPGGPFAGPCFGRDGAALAALAEDVGASGALMAATREVNEGLVAQHTARLWDLALEDVPPTRVPRVAILGLAYKLGTSVCTGSLGTRVGQALSDRGVAIAWHDDLVTEVGFGASMSAQDAVLWADVVLIAQPLPAYGDLDYGERFVVDVWRVLGDRPNTFTVGVGQHG